MKGSEITTFLEKRGVTQVEFAKAIDTAQESVNRWINKDSKLQSRSVAKILEAYPDFYEDGKKYVDKQESISIASEKNKAYAKDKHINVIEANTIDDFMMKNLPPIGKIDIADFIDATDGVLMTGDSLGGDIKGGDVLAYKEWYPRNYFDYGRIYIVATRDHIFARYLKKHKEKGMVLLKSKNEFYDDIDLPISEIKSLYVVNGAIVRG